MTELTLLRDIANAAATVRDRQRRYFKTRSREVLELSRSAERHLDNLLSQYQERTAVRQGDLLADPDEPP